MAKHRESKQLKMIDLFAGIGGFRIAAERNNLECVFTSEWDKFAQKTYSANFDGYIDGDITKIEEKNIPAHDIMCGGFPCQPFSISGKQRGFTDTRGTLVYDMLRIAKHHKPKVLFLENVKNLVGHDNGETFKTILAAIDEIGYDAFYEVLNASDYRVPQARKRTYIVCFRKDLKVSSFTFPKPSNSVVSLEDYLLPVGDSRLDDLFITNRKDLVLTPKPNSVAENKPIQVGHFASGRQGERVYDIKGHAITLSAQGGGIAGKTGAYLVNGKIRQLHPIECARAQGFPSNFKIPVSNAQAWKQFGNSVAVPVLNLIFKRILKTLEVE